MHELLAHPERRAVVAMPVRVVVALLIAEVHEVGDGGVKQRRYAVDSAYETPTSHQREGKPAGNLDLRTGSGGMATGDIGNRDPVGVQHRARVEHRWMVADAHKCPRPTAPTRGSFAHG